MRILVSNDDGVNAPGINILAKHLSTIADVTIVAPLEERSATGHTISLDVPLRVVEIEKNKFGCSGYPADCSLLGFAHILKNKPDLVVSGINRGANLAQDIYYSGTVAAAREASFHNIPSIAISTVVDMFSLSEAEIHFDTAAEFVTNFIKADAWKHINPLSLLNINVPNISSNEVEGVEVTKLGFRNYSEKILEREDSKSRPYYWVGGTYEGFKPIIGSDCVAIDQNKISLTPLNLLDFSTDEKDKWSKIITEII